MLRCSKRLLACLLLSGSLFAAGQSGVWLDVPFVRQSKNACGAASIAMVMEYWQRQQGQPASADAEEIQRTLYSPSAGGIYAADLERYLQQHKFRTFAFHGEWKDLSEHLEKGRPLIVALQPDGDDLHYVVVTGVVTGLDRQKELVLKNDPAERKSLKQDRSSFEKEWKGAGNWTLLAVPQPDVQP